MFDDIKKKFSSTDSLIIFIHGIATRSNDWECLLEILCPGQYQFIRWNKLGSYSIGKHSVFSLSFFTGSFLDDYTEASMELYAERILALVTLLPPKKKLIFVAHSLGGLVVKHILVFHPEILKRTKKVLTIGTPNLGVPLTLPYPQVISQLNRRGKYIKNLNNMWIQTKLVKKKNWGVIGGIVNSLMNGILPQPYRTDGAGPGFVAIQSAIPFEWKKCKLNEVYNRSELYGFCMKVYAGHQELLCCKQILPGMQWVLQ